MAAVEYENADGINKTPVSAATPLPTTPAGGVASGATDSGNPVKIGAVYNSAPTALTTGQRTDLHTDNYGSLNVVLMAAGNVAGAYVPMGVMSSVGGGNVAGSTSLNCGLVLYNGSTFTTAYQIANGVNSIGTGALAVGLVAQLDDVSPTAITENQFGNLRMNAARALTISAKPDTLGGLTPSRIVTGTSGVVKASAGQVYAITAYNVNAAVRYLHLYNKATAPTLSTDTPIMTIPLMPTSVRDIIITDIGAAFGTGIAWAYTTDDIAIPATAATSTELHATILYN